MTEDGKINPKLPFFVLETLSKDSVIFSIPINTIFNLVYSFYKYKYNHNIKIDIKGKYDSKKALSLNAKNSSEFRSIISKKYNQVFEAEYFRNILFQYSCLPIYEREKVLFDKHMMKIEKTLKEKKALYIYMHGHYRKIDPYFLKKTEEFNYVFGYDYDKNEYRCFRISHLKNVDISDERINRYNKDEVSGYEKNFDPFLSYGKRVKVKFTPNGVKKYKKTLNNRPKKISEEDEVFVFECNVFKAKIYFPQFLDDVEILEPKELRDWFKKGLSNALKKYK